MDGSTGIPINPNVQLGRYANRDPVVLRQLGPCPICGFPLVLQDWGPDGVKRDHQLPRSRFPTLQSAVDFLNRHP